MNFHKYCVPPFSGDAYSGRHASNGDECAICCVAVSDRDVYCAVVVSGGSRWGDENSDQDDPGYMGVFPICPNCHEKYLVKDCYIILLPEAAPSDGERPRTLEIGSDLLDLLERVLKRGERLVRYSQRQLCSHEETRREGFIWEVCMMCGSKWADDEGGKPEFEEPLEITTMDAILEELSGKVEELKEKASESVTSGIREYPVPTEPGYYWVLRYGHPLSQTIAWVDRGPSGFLAFRFPGEQCATYLEGPYKDDTPSVRWISDRVEPPGPEDI